MKYYALTFCALTLPISAQSADVTLTDINTRLQKLESELKQSQIKLHYAEQKINRAEERTAIAEYKASLAQERLRIVEQKTDNNISLIKSKPANNIVTSDNNTEIKFGAMPGQGS